MPVAPANQGHDELSPSALLVANSAHRVLAGRRRFCATAPLDRISRPPPIRSSGAAPLLGTAWTLSPRSGSPRQHNRARRHCRSRRDRATISPAESPGADRLPEREPRGRRGQRDYSRADAMTGACRNLANGRRPFGPIATPVTPIPLLLLAVAGVVPDEDVRLRDSRQSFMRAVRPEGIDDSVRGRRWRLPYGCWPRNLMSIR
jgi:hypothetical protein